MGHCCPAMWGKLFCVGECRKIGTGAVGLAAVLRVCTG